MRILAIETSCDETAIAIAEFTGPKAVPRISVLSNIVSSQIAVHRKFGGVVPNLARREHEKNLTFILERAFKEARFSNFKFQITNHKQIPNSKIKKIEKILEREPELFERFKKHILPLKKPGIDAIAVTYGPGLAPALWVGVNFARAL
ncbi:MAG: O-sialoglycoprotein endopeptidase (Glycoprotease), partial [Parcubacteria group bacterium GW2011_GWB1_50_9]